MDISEGSLRTAQGSCDTEVQKVVTAALDIKEL